MDVIRQIIERAKQNKQRIVLPEGTDERVLIAANQILADGVAELYILGDPTLIQQKAQNLQLPNLAKATLINPQAHPKKDTYTRLLYELRKDKGITPDEAAHWVENPLYLACLMIKNQDADGELAGAQYTTGDVLRPAFQLIKTAPNISVVSGTFIMVLPNTHYGNDGILFFADCAVMPNPNAKELAEIAVASAQTARALVGIEPRVAMLSFSTKGSAKNELCDKVIEATEIAKTINPKLQIDGELQADAALIPAIAKIKAPNSIVAGKANVLVFPSLESGNIAYKLVERLAGAKAIGPVLQGMAAPINDLSRGCSVEDIYNMVAITANQAIAKHEQ